VRHYYIDYIDYGVFWLKSEAGTGELSITVTDPSTSVPPPIITTRTTGSSKGWEILKSIVYGSLAELLASLSVVTSAASADSTTCM